MNAETKISIEDVLLNRKYLTNKVKNTVLTIWIMLQIVRN